MCIDMCTDERVGACMDMRIDMSTGTCLDTCMEMRMNICIDVCIKVDVDTMATPFFSIMSLTTVPHDIGTRCSGHSSSIDHAAAAQKNTLLV